MFYLFSYTIMTFGSISYLIWKHPIGNFRIYFLYPFGTYATYVFGCAADGKKYKRKLWRTKRDNWCRQMCGLQKGYRSQQSSQ